METDDGYDRAIWQQLSGELGLTAVHIPEAYGGQGFGVSELAIAVEEMGRALLCAPYFASTVLAATAILKAGTEEQKRSLLPGIAAGETIATLAFTEANGRWDADGIAATATAAGGKYKLDGVKSFVLDGHTADLIVVAARRPGSKGSEGLSLFTVRGDAQGLQRQRLDTHGPDAQAGAADVLGRGGGACSARKARPPVRCSATLDIAAICLANEMVGGAERLRESPASSSPTCASSSAAPIASFQSLKHKAADMLLERRAGEVRRLLRGRGRRRGRSRKCRRSPRWPRPPHPRPTCRPRSTPCRFHGGIGFTWDNDTQLWFKRAKSSEVFLGTAADHRERLMQLWNV